MSLSISLDLAYEFAVKAPYKTVFDLLSDVPASASHFPQIETLTDLGQQRFRWQMQKVGNDQISLQTVYASAYTSNRRKGTITWVPVDGVGNARVSGSWAVSNRKTHTHLVLHISGTVDTPLPALMKVVVVPLVQAEFEQLVETYIDNLIEHFGGEVEIDS